MSVDCADEVLFNIDSRVLWANIETAGPRTQTYLGTASVDSDEAVRLEHARRRSFIASYAYAVPTREAIGAIADFVTGHRVLEVCAGRGLWARILSDVGVDVLATDAERPNGGTYYAVDELDAETTVKARPDHSALLICWPPNNQGIAYRALRAFMGTRMIYVGDDRFTGDADFQASLTKDWLLNLQLPLPQWPGINDGVRLYSRL